MTILIVLIGLLISHFATGFRHLRDFRWLLWPMHRMRRQFPDRPWLAFVMVPATAIVVAVLATWLMIALLGVIGWALLALAVFIYTLGPRDLNRDVNLLLARREADSAGKVEKAADAMQLQIDQSSSDEAAAAVFHAGLSRWFGILFWFVLLGIPGAIVYRLTRIALQEDELTSAEIDWLARLRMILDWPVLALMGLSAGLCADLDRVFRAWKEQREQHGPWLLTPSLLDRIAASLCTEANDFDTGLTTGHRIVWRMLILWLVVLSVLLLAGWLV
jgi:AmpE protein